MPEVTSVSASKPGGVASDPLLDEIGNATVAAYASATQSTVATIQQLNTVLVASLTSALTRNQLGVDDPAPNDDDAEDEPVDAAAASTQPPLRASLEAVLARVEQSAGTTPLSTALLGSASALSIALDLLNAAVLQQAINVTRAVLSTDVNLAGPASPSQAVVLVQVLKGDAVAQTLQNLSAAAPASKA